MITKKIHIPKLLNNLDIKINPSYEKIKKQSDEFILSYKIFGSDINKKKFDDLNLAFWSNICYPEIKDESRMLNITNFFTLLFIIDDYLENYEKVPDNIDKTFFDILNGNLDPKSDIEKIFKNIWDSIIKSLSNRQQNNFLEYTKEWVEGARFIFDNSYNLNIDLYMKHRFKSIGAMVSFIAIEYGLDINLEKYYPELKELQKLAGENIILVNDLFSFRKEYYENKDNPNIITLISTRYKCSIQKAIYRVSRLINNNQKKIIKLHDKIFKLYNDYKLNNYIKSLECLISGNFYWSCTSPRYHGVGFNNTLMYGTYVIFDPNKTIIINQNPIFRNIIYKLKNIINID